jgi:RNA-directed DNA polymerase
MSELLKEMNTVYTLMAYDLKLDYDYIARLASHADSLYKEYRIPKRTIGYRKIAQPSRELKTLQYWLLRNVLEQIALKRDNIFAYEKGCSIRKHALYHAGNCHFFHADVKNFFNNIHFSLLSPFIDSSQTSINKHLRETVLRDKRLDYQDSESMLIRIEDIYEAINAICFRRGNLCIGAVSSPKISNIIMQNIDQSLTDYCSPLGYRYSRYADDIYISSKSYIVEDLVTFVSEKLQSLNLRLNLSKTHYSSTKNHQSVTGLVITTDGNISIGKERRLKIKHELYEFSKNNDALSAAQIMGDLAFLMNIEPETFNNFMVKYAKYFHGDVMNAIQGAAISPIF